MPVPAQPIVAILLGYLVGALPVGILVCKPLGIDPRRFGSGRTGGSNVYRAAGLGAAVATVLGDVFKGTLAVALASRVAPGDGHEWATALAALAAIAGHNYSVFIGFAGGAGSTPNIGAFLALAPTPLWFAAAAAISCAIWFTTRIASVASLSLTVCILAACVWLVVDGDRPPALLAYGVGQLALIAWALRPNIARLIEGTEPRIGRHSPPSAAAGD